MSRGISQTVIDELAKDSFRMATLVSIDLTQTYFMTDWQHDLSYGGDTYESSGHLLSVGSVSESQDIGSSELDIELSGKNQTFVSLFLNSNTDWMNSQVSIVRVVINDSGAVIGHAAEHKGHISSFAIKGDNVLVTIASHWADFERVTGRRTNDKSQQAHYPGDTGLEYASEIKKDIKWGRA